MLSIICMCLPPLLMMLCREKWVGEKIDCAFNRDLKTLAKEYLLSVLFLNLVAIAITFKIFHHDGSIVSSLNESASFTFHYLLLMIGLAAAEPVIENILRFHTNVKLRKFTVKESKINLCIYAYAFVLVLMNFIRIFDNSFWGDEGYSIKLAQMSVSDMISATASDVHPPLHYLLAQLLYHILGSSGTTYHLVGFLPYLVIVILGCTVVRKYFGKIPEVVLITMSSLMYYALTHNIEVRMYSLAAMFILIAYIAFYMILTRNSVWCWVVFCIASLGAAYTHYYALLSVALLYLMLILLALKKKEYRKGTLASYVATVLAYLPWLVVLVDSFKRTANDWWLEEYLSLKDCLYTLLDNKYILVLAFVAILLFCLYQANILRIKISSEKDIRKKIDLSINFEKLELNRELYWVMAGIVSIAGTIAVGLALSYIVRPFLVHRYLFPLTGIMYLMIGVCISKLKFPKAWATVLVLLVLWTHIPMYISTVEEDSSFDAGTTSFLVNVQPETSERIITDNSHMSWTLLDYYYQDNTHEYNQEAITNLNTNDDTVWLFWTEELDSSAIRNVQNQHYSVEKIYESDFANDYYYAYKLTRKE